MTAEYIGEPMIVALANPGSDTGHLALQITDASGVSQLQGRGDPCTQWFIPGSFVAGERGVAKEYRFAEIPSTGLRAGSSTPAVCAQAKSSPVTKDFSLLDLLPRTLPEAGFLRFAQNDTRKK
jgi:hypothetical protein